MANLTHGNGSDSWRSFVKGREHMHDTKPVRGAINEWFSPYAWPGGYPVLFLSGGDTFCADCAKEIFFSEGNEVYADCYYEGPSTYCDNCNKEIESAYGDPEDDSE